MPYPNANCMQKIIIFIKPVNEYGTNNVNKLVISLTYMGLPKAEFQM